MGEDPSAKIERLLRKAAEDPQFKALLLTLSVTSCATDRLWCSTCRRPRCSIPFLEEQLASMIETVIEKLRHRLERTCDGPAIFGGRAFEHARLVGIRPEPQTNLPLV